MYKLPTSTPPTFSHMTHVLQLIPFDLLYFWLKRFCTRLIRSTSSNGRTSLVKLETFAVHNKKCRHVMLPFRVMWFYLLCKEGSLMNMSAFLSLDEAIAARAGIVIVSGSDGRMGGWRRFSSQLKHSKTVRDDNICKQGANRNPRAGYRMSVSHQQRPL